MYDKVRIFFRDDNGNESSSVAWMHILTDFEDAIEEICYDEDWVLANVIDWEFEEIN